MPTLLTPQLQSFAKLGRIIRSGVFDFAEGITDQSVLDDLQAALEVDAGRIDRIYEVSLDGDTFSGVSIQLISPASGEIINILKALADKQIKFPFN